MYRELDDNELIYMINENTDYYEIMFEKYKPHIFQICRKYVKQGKKIGYELEDLVQVANIGLIDALNSYKDNQNVLFFTYLTTCIKNKLMGEFRTNSTNKKLALNQSISYDEPIPGTNLTLYEAIPDRTSLEPLNRLIIEERQIEYINFINSLPFEVAVIYELKINGFNANDIARFLDIDKKVISKSLEIAKIARKAYV